MTFKHELVLLPELNTVQTENGRFYLGSNGQKYPSVTTILGKRKEKIVALNEWRRRVGEKQASRISTMAANRGTNVHKLVEDFVMNIPVDYRRVMPLPASMFKSIQPCIEEHLKVVRAIEVALLSDTLKLAGRTDIIGTWDDYNSVIDIKTSTRVKKENDILDYFLQCTAYAIMFEELTGIDTPKIVVVIANEYQPPSIFVKDTSEYEPILMEYLAEYNP